MSSKSSILLSLLGSVIIIVIFELIVIQKNSGSNTDREEIKRQAAEVTLLPDLALSTESTWLRHRSLATPFSIFPEDGALLDYYPSSFVFQMYINSPEPRESRP